MVSASFPKAQVVFFLLAGPDHFFTLTSFCYTFSIKRWLSVFCHTRLCLLGSLQSHKICQNLNIIHLVPPHFFWCCEDSSKPSSASSSNENTFLILPISLGYSHHIDGYAVQSIDCPIEYFSIPVLWTGCWAFCGWKRQTDEVSAEL